MPSRVALEAIGDGLWQDVEEEALRPGERHVACAHGVLQEQVRRQRHAGDVEDEERDADAVGDRGRIAREEGVEDARDQGQAEKADEPRD
jgi:hypothetical protein